MKFMRMLYQWGLSVLAMPLISFSAHAQEQQAEQPATQNLIDVAETQWETAKNLVNIIIEFCVKYSFQVLGGIIVLILGWIVAGYVANLIMKLLQKQDIDVTVCKFITGIVKLSIMAFAVIVALGKFGIEIAPLIAGISVAGFGLSFALQGPLSNFAAGASLIFTKPFKVGDIIEVAGQNGEVRDIKLPRTELKTIDGEKVVIPNNHIIGEIIHNYSGHRRVDIKVGVSYKADITAAIDTVRKVITSDARVTSEKEPKIGVSDFGDSSVNIYARLWCKQNDYWDVLFDLNKNIFDAFNVKSIEIPFPQRDIHIIEQKAKPSKRI